MTRPLRPGFTVIEAAIALAIVGMASAGALAAVAAHSRTAARAESRAIGQVLAEDVLMRLQLTPARELVPMADSLARGDFPAPFADCSWRASATPVRGQPRLIELRVVVAHGSDSTELRTRRFIPEPRGTP